MVHAQFESAQFKPSESGNSSNTDSASAKMLLEAQSYQVLDRSVSHARGTVGVGAGDNTGTKIVNKEIDKMINGFDIKADEAAADKSAIACRMLKGQKVEFGRIFPIDENGKEVEPPLGTPTDQDRATKFERYLSDLCNPHK